MSKQHQQGSAKTVAAAGLGSGVATGRSNSERLERLVSGGLTRARRLDPLGSNHAANEELNELGGLYGTLTNNAVGAGGNLAGEAGAEAAPLLAAGTPTGVPQMTAPTARGGAARIPQAPARVAPPTAIAPTEMRAPGTRSAIVPQAPGPAPRAPAGVRPTSMLPAPAVNVPAPIGPATNGLADPIELAQVGNAERNALHPSQLLNAPGMPLILSALSVAQGVDQARTGVQQLRGRQADPHGEGLVNVAGGVTGAVSGTVGAVGALAPGLVPAGGLVAGTGAVTGAAAGGIALGMRGNQEAREHGWAGRRSGVAGRRGVSADADPGGPNRDWSDMAADAGQSVQRTVRRAELGGHHLPEQVATAAGLVATGLAAQHLIVPAMATGAIGLGRDVVGAARRLPGSDPNDLIARDEEERGVPMAQSANDAVREQRQALAAARAERPVAQGDSARLDEALRRIGAGRSASEREMLLRHDPPDIQASVRSVLGAGLTGGL